MAAGLAAADAVQLVPRHDTAVEFSAVMVGLLQCYFAAQRSTVGGR